MGVGGGRERQKKKVERERERESILKDLLLWFFFFFSFPLFPRSVCMCVWTVRETWRYIYFIPIRSAAQRHVIKITNGIIAGAAARIFPLFCSPLRWNRVDIDTVYYNLFRRDSRWGRHQGPILAIYLTRLYDSPTIFPCCSAPP